MSSEERKQNDLNLKTGASSWFTTLPIKEEGYIWNKQSFGICYLADMAGDWNEFQVIVHVVIHLIYNTLSSVQKKGSWLYATTIFAMQQRTCLPKKLVYLQKCPCRTTTAGVEWWNAFREDCE